MTVSGGGPVSTANMVTRLVSMWDGFGRHRSRSTQVQQGDANRTIRAAMRWWDTRTIVSRACQRACRDYWKDMQDPIGQRVKIVSGKHAGLEGTVEAIDRSGATVGVERRSLWGILHYMRAVVVPVGEIEVEA